jgi:hypothetical protein
LSRQSYGDGLDVGLPEPVDGVFTHDVAVSNLEASFVVITSYDSGGLESAHSNERIYLLD